MTIRGIELFGAAWISLLYFERLVYDNYLYRFGPGRTGLLRSVTPGTITLILVGPPLQSLAISLRPQSAQQLANWLRVIVDSVWAVVRDWRSYAITGAAILLGVLLKATLRGRPIATVASGWWDWAKGEFREWAHVGAAVLAAYSLWLVTFFLATSAGPVPVPAAIVTWCASGLFIVTHHAIAVVVFYLEIARRLRKTPNARTLAVTGFLKDSTIYSVIALFVASGLVKFETTVPAIPSAARWPALAWIAAPMVAVAVLVLLVDVLFAERVLLDRARWAKVWRNQWQRQTVHTHVYLRDFAMVVPGLIVLFAWLALQIARAES